MEDLESFSQSFEEIIAALPGHIYWKDRNGILMGCNDEQARSIGLDSRFDIVGLTAKDTLPREFAETVMRLDEEIMSSGVPQLREEVLTLEDGKKSVWLSKKTPLKNKKGELIGLIGVSLDITLQKKLEQELFEAKARQELLEIKAREERFKSMAALGGMIAHELRTPLTGLGLNAITIGELLPLLIEGYELSAAEGRVKPIRKDKLKLLTQSVSQMGRSINYAQSTITTILAGFHHTDAESKISIVPFSLDLLVQQTIADYPFDVDEDHLVFLTSLDSVQVLGEPQMVMHVIHNLLKNALYIIDAEGKGCIRIWMERDEKSAYLFVEDTAKGIPHEQLQKIFEAFFTTKKKTAVSIGLGLYFCKQVLQKMGGDITCESVLGKFTRFKISLPLVAHPRDNI